jgi:WD40 repeat protein
MTQAIPSILQGRYEITNVVGRGGEGTLVHAIDQRHGRSVALKLRPIPADAVDAERFLVEARTLLQLRPHPALPLARDDFFEGDRHVLVLDWIDGVDLAAVLADQGRPGLPMATVLRWLAPVAEALTHLHRSDPAIVHGDVKPANIIVRPNGEVVLVDFGMSSTRGVVPRGGTPGFRAPEVGTGGLPSRAADVYGIAATAFALLTGAAPAGVMPDWHGVEPARAARLEAALRRAMATNPTHRTATPGEFIEELRSGWDSQPFATGVVSFVATELVGDNQLWEEAPERAAALLTAYAAIVDRVVEDHGGRRIGDAPGIDTSLSEFVRADDALSASIALQHELAGQSLPVRCAMHTGEISVVEGRLSGPTVRRAVALCGLGEPGQVLLTSASARLVAGTVPAGTRLLDLGAHRLDGIAEPVNIVAVDAPGLVVPPDPNQSPYPGLGAFQVDDQDLFFGRESVVDTILSKIGPGRVVAVVGASGSGKSSIVRAGVMPRLHNPVLVTPGDDPEQALARASVSDGPLIVDQCEELFTLCADEDVQHRFAAALVEHPAGCVLAIRADLYGRIAELPRLADAVTRDHVLIGRLTDDELRQAIEQPALSRGFTLESGLTELVLAEARAEPGALPHVAHALRETWLRRDGRTLTVAGYGAAGGVRAALVQTAETLYDALDQLERPVLHDLLLRMVEPGEGVADARRRVRRDDVASLDGSVDSLLHRLALARLVTIEHETVEPAHEALLRDWPRLRGWIDGARESLRLQRAVSVAAIEWDQHDRDPSRLYRGARLAGTMGWADAEQQRQFTPLERDFLSASAAQVDSELNEALHAARRLRRLFVGVASLLVLALIAGAAAFVQRRQAQHQTVVADARGLAAQAIATTPTQVDKALLLAAEGYRRDKSFDTQAGLLTALNGARFTTSSNVPLPTNIEDIAATPDGKQLVTLTYDGVLQSYDTTSWRPVGAPIARGIAKPNIVTVSHDGSMLSYGAADGVHVVRINDGTEIAAIGGAPGFLGAFSENDKFVVALFEDPVIRILDLLSGAEKGHVDVAGELPVADARPGHDEFVAGGFSGDPNLRRYRLDGTPIAPPVDLGMPLFAVFYSRDGQVLFAVRGDGSVSLLDPELLTPIAPGFSGRGSRIVDASLSSDGNLVAVAGDDGSIRIATPSGRVIATIGGLSGSVSIEFLDDHRIIAVELTGGKAVTYDLRQQTTMGKTANQSQNVRDLIATRSGKTAVIEEDDRVVELDIGLQPGPRTTASADDFSTAFAVTADESLIAISTARTDLATKRITGFINILDYRTNQPRARIASGPPRVSRMEFSPDGTRLAVIDAAGQLTILSPAGEKLLQPVKLDSLSLHALRWSEDGRSLYVGGQDGLLREVDPMTGVVKRDLSLTPTFSLMDIDQVPGAEWVAVASEAGQVQVVDAVTFKTIGHPLVAGGTQLQAVAISADAALIAATSRDGSLRIWDSKTGRNIGPSLDAHGVQSTGIAFVCPGSQHLMTGGFDGTVVSWDLDPASWLRQACILAGRNLTKTEWAQYLPGRTYRRTCDQYPAGT